MTSMNISLPEQMKHWIEAKVAGGRYHNASEYIRDLIRKDQNNLEKTEAFRAAILAGRDSGIDTRSFDEIINDAKLKVKS